jgi:hypothetical protein
MRPVAMTSSVAPRMPMYPPGGPGLGQQIFYGQAPPAIIPSQVTGFLICVLWYFCLWFSLMNICVISLLWLRMSFGCKFIIIFNTCFFLTFHLYSCQPGFGYQQQLVPGMRPGGAPMANFFVPMVQQGQQGQRPGGRRAGAVQQTQQPVPLMQQQVDSVFLLLFPLHLYDLYQSNNFYDGLF